MANEPVACRPEMPGYGVPDSMDDVLPWAWAEERLKANRNYWVSSSRKDGRPHAMPVWGQWMPEGLYFSTGMGSVKARNLQRDARCVVTTERGDEAVIVEGLAESVSDGPEVAAFLAEYRAKYDWPMSEADGPFWLVRPVKAFGFIEAAEQFGKTATRWVWARREA